MKSIYRRLMNARLKPILGSMRGKALDLASSASPSYRSFFDANMEVVSADVKAGQDVSRIDFDAALPFPDASFDHALCVNALYIAKDPVFTLKELRRVVRPGGSVVIVAPFIFPEAPEPHDYVRWTSEGLKSIFAEAGFAQVKVSSFGGHFTSSLFVVEPFQYFRLLKLFSQECAILLDRLVPARYRAARPCPLGYVTIAVR
jgi:SAM-dependent methyltransferase